VLPPDTPLAALLDLQDNVVHVAQARRHLSEKAIRHRVASGRWQQAHRSVFVTHSGPVGPEQRRWIAVLAAACGGPDRCSVDRGGVSDAVIGGVTAAEAAGLRGFGGRPVHLLLPAGRRARSLPAGTVAHRTSILDQRDILAVGRPPRTRTARSLVDAAQWARTDTEARAIIAAGFQQRLVTGADVQDVLRRLPRARRRQLIEMTVDDAIGGAHSIAEIEFLQLCRKNRLPEPSRQVVRRGADGRRRYLDAYFDEWGVHVEIDGGQHLDPRQAWSDMRRQNELWIAGDRVLRFPTWALRTDPAGVIAQVRAALVAAGWPG
jgi:very-short-patch-repair endonuclease